MSVVAREELCKSPVMFNAYAELNVPNFGVDIDIPSEVDYYTVNQARRVARDTVSERVHNLVLLCSSYSYHERAVHVSLIAAVTFEMSNSLAHLHTLTLSLWILLESN